MRETNWLNLWLLFVVSDVIFFCWFLIMPISTAVFSDKSSGTGLFKLISWNLGGWNNFEGLATFPESRSLFKISLTSDLTVAINKMIYPTINK